MKMSKHTQDLNYLL